MAYQIGIPHLAEAKKGARYPMEHALSLPELQVISLLQIRSRIYCSKYADLDQYRTKLSTNKLTHAFGRY
jgi:hypothetical protein